MQYCIIVLSALFAMILFLLWNNLSIRVSFEDYTDPELPADADGITVAHISDIHNSVLMPKIAKKIKNQKPDVIVITGDLISRNHKDFSASFDFLKQLSAISPTLYVMGNHEFSIKNKEEFYKSIENTGVTFLQNDSVCLFGITWIGINDRHFWQGIKTPEATEQIIHKFLEDTASRHDYSVLLAHRPRLSVYDNTGVRLVFSGHYHGGLWRIPGIGGIISPDEGWFPAYTAGFYQGETIRMYLNRGIGNSGITFRLFNRPDLSYITFHK